MYADDLLLLALSIGDLQRMVDICRNELVWFDMRINIKKSLCLRVGKRFNCIPQNIEYEGNPIPWCKELKYLGIHICASTKFKVDFHMCKVKYYRGLNSLLGKLGRTASVNVTLSLVSSFATPILLYGLEASTLGVSEVEKLTFAFNSVYVKLFSTFDKSVIMSCQYYTGQLPLKYLLDLRVLNFYRTLKRNSSSNSTASLLFDWFGMSELLVIIKRNGLHLSNSDWVCKQKMWSLFELSCLNQS
jgi:hypothetical protein